MVRNWPEKVDLYFEGGEATDPAVGWKDSTYSSAVPDWRIPKSTDGVTEGEDYRLYRTTTREVFGYTDYSRWDQFMSMLGNIIWWILLAIAALIALIYILEHWKDITSLYHKCLAGSIAIHLVILFLMMIWMITKEFTAGGNLRNRKLQLASMRLPRRSLPSRVCPRKPK